MAAIKRRVQQDCDSCGREFTPKKIVASEGDRIEWTCPYCGHDNKTGSEFAKNAQSIATKRSAEAKKNG